MTRLEDPQVLAGETAPACAAGTRLAPACALAGMGQRTLQRWRAGEGLSQDDRRPEATTPRPRMP
jgi:hypothetical protein